MEPQVQLLSKPQIDLETFLGVSQAALGYHLLKPIDKSRKSSTEYDKFITALACFHSEESTNRPVREIILNSASLCAHLHFSFLVAAPNNLIFKSMERSNLPHTVAAETSDELQLAVISGSLDVWKHSILECCTATTDKNLRLLYNKFLIEFDKLGIYWSDINRHPMKDKTLRLSCSN